MTSLLEHRCKRRILEQVFWNENTSLSILTRKLRLGYYFQVPFYHDFGPSIVFLKYTGSSEELTSSFDVTC